MKKKKEEKKKVCKVCGDSKSLKEFVIHKNYKDGHSNICKACNREKYQHSFRNQVISSLDEIKEKLDVLTSK